MSIRTGAEGGRGQFPIRAWCLPNRGIGDVLPAWFPTRRTRDTFGASVIASVIALAESENRRKQTGADDRTRKRQLADIMGVVLTTPVFVGVSENCGKDSLPPSHPPPRSEFTSATARCLAVARSAKADPEPSSIPGSHSDRTSMISNTSTIDYQQLDLEREILSLLRLPAGFSSAKAAVLEPVRPK